MIDAPAAGPGRPAPAWWSPWTATGATLAYTALAIVFTWPLATRLTRAIPWDMGDPVLNSWILAWSADHLLALPDRATSAPSPATGTRTSSTPSRSPSPTPSTCSAQALLVLPVWAATGNAVLCYNLVLLGTFVLSGLGAFLLARDLTGDPRAAFVAGVVFGFAPYRIAQLSHVQVLSAQWMPFALFALRRHLATDRWAPLGAFTAAMVLQHLSCGYYLVYFTPLVAAFAALRDRSAPPVARRWPPRPAVRRRRWSSPRPRGRSSHRISRSGARLPAASARRGDAVLRQHLGIPDRAPGASGCGGRSWRRGASRKANCSPASIAVLLALAGTSSVARAAWAGSAACRPGHGLAPTRRRGGGHRPGGRYRRRARAARRRRRLGPRQRTARSRVGRRRRVRTGRAGVAAVLLVVSRRARAGGAHVRAVAGVLVPAAGRRRRHPVVRAGRPGRDRRWSCGTRRTGGCTSTCRVTTGCACRRATR